ncbi:MAG: ATP synthase F1 subunit delta [Acidobacteria bacterium]|nr:MAG: ATP synthase F1 subunit delta [Acidobacteriota bacterium]
MSRTIDERQLAIARVYAQALLGLAESSGEVDQILEELLQLGSLMDEAPELGDYLQSPLVKEESRREAVESLFRGRLSDLLVDTLQVMNRKGRLELIHALVEAYRQEYEVLRGQVDVRITTAIPLSDRVRQRLRVTTSKLTGKEAQLVEKIEPSILGGMILQIGDGKMDTSIARKIRKLAEEMVERASRELHGGSQHVSTS